MFPHPSLNSAKLQTLNPIDAVIVDLDLIILLLCSVYEPTKLLCPKRGFKIKQKNTI